MCDTLSGRLVEQHLHTSRRWHLRLPVHLGDWQLEGVLPGHSREGLQRLGAQQTRRGSRQTR